MTDSERIGFVVLLDSNVLAKPLTRTLVMAAGSLSGYGATWSRYEEDEANRHMCPEQSTATIVRALSGAELAPSGVDANRYGGTSTKDRQVLADAVAAGALFLITEDVDDFDEGDLEAAGVAAVNPDLFLSLKATPDGYREALTFVAQRFKRPERTVAQLHVQIGRAHPLTVESQVSLFPDDQPKPAAHNPPAEMYRGNRCLNCLQTKQDVRLGWCPECTAHVGANSGSKV